MGFCHCRFVVYIAVVLSSFQGHAAPVHLQCNYQEKALGIDTAKPSLSWQSDSLERNWLQSAYRISVASRPELAVPGKADVWDSGRQTSSESVDIPYLGPALESRHRYYWSVAVWDQTARETVSAPTWWEMGLLGQTDWSAQWIGAPDRRPQLAEGLRWVWLADSDPFNVSSAATGTFRYSFDLAAKPLRANLYVTARSEMTASVNGHVSGHKKDWAAFDNEDIAPLLHAGRNEVEIVVTAASPIARPGAPAPPTIVAGFAARISLTAPDGSVNAINAGRDWQGKSKDGSWSAAQDFAALTDPRMGPDPGLPAQPATLLRTSFTVSKTVRQARLYVTAAGSYKMSLDGHAVDADELTPDFTDYRVRIPYQTYDVTGLIAHGAHVLGATLGDGWFQSPMTWAGTRFIAGPDRLLAQLEITYTDGSRDVIASSPDWKTSPAPILSSEIYAGERYDARLAQRGWDTAAFNAAAWSEAAAFPAPAGSITAQIGRPVHITNTLHPTARRRLANGDWLFDMGQNMVGWTTLHVAGAAGTVIRLRFAERLKPEGDIYTENLRNADAEDTYVLRGGGRPEVWSPSFTFHGFRYVQVSGLPEAPAADTLTGQVLNSLDKDPTGHLQTSSPMLNRMWNLGVWGQRGNFVSIPTDCPQRDERLGWMGDAGVFWRTGAYNFDIAAFTRKYMTDIVDAQTPAGAFTNISPNIMRPGVGAPGWGDAGIIVPYTTWLQYGDRSLVEKNWSAMEHWMDFIAAANPNFLREKQLGANFGDWLAPDQNTPRTLVGTAYWAILAGMMRDMATATGHDPSRYRALVDHIRTAYQAEWVKPDGSVQGDTQTAYLLTLYAGLAPEALRSAIADRLVANINAHRTHLTTGFLGTPFLLFALSESGHTDTAYKLLFQDTYPSWGYMVAKGATTWWERWNGDSGDPAMNSYNHYSFGSVMAWVYRDTVGIEPSATGFRHLVLHPHPTGELQYASGTYDSVYGKIRSSWKRTPAGLIDWTVTIPPNTTAQVTLERKSGTMTKADLGSGTYRFVDGEAVRR